MQYATAVQTAAVLEKKPRRAGVFLLCGAAAVAVAFGWQFVVVQFAYGGQWTALFHIGDARPLPAPLAGSPGGPSPVYQFTNSPGYDGQFYLYIAHDPFLRSAPAEYVDNPPLRWRRIAVPLLAHLLAAGRPRLIPAAYILVVLASVFAGAYWLARFSEQAGITTWAGLAFLAVPATAVSLERMTVDAMLAAVAVAFAFYASQKEQPCAWKLLPVIAVAPLVRETGLALPAATAAFLALRRAWKEAVVAAAGILPWLGWTIYVRSRSWADGTPWMTPVPFSGLVWRTIHPLQYEITGRWTALAAALDYVGIIGIWLAVLAAATFVVRRRWGLLEMATVLFACAAGLVAKSDVWADAYAFSRTMTPLLLWPALAAIKERRWWMAVPMAMNVPRIALQIATVTLAAMR